MARNTVNERVCVCVWGGGKNDAQMKDKLVDKGKYTEFCPFHILVGHMDLRSLADHASLSWTFGTKNCTGMI